MNGSLTDQVVLVTGASSGIGRATVLALSRAGAKIVAGGRRIDQLRALADEAPGEVLAVELDVTRIASAEQAIATAVAHFGRLDALVNNAGVMLAGMILDADTSQWVQMVETNLLGSMFAVHAALPHLIEAQGAVVQISSTSGRTASAGSGVYAATKFGVTAFAEALRQEVTERGVRVTVVEPGFVDTELTSHITDPVMRDAAASIGASMRTLQADDIAEVVAFALGRPAHVAMNEILVRPTDQVR